MATLAERAMEIVEDIDHQTFALKEEHLRPRFVILTPDDFIIFASFLTNEFTGVHWRPGGATPYLASNPEDVATLMKVWKSYNLTAYKGLSIVVMREAPQSPWVLPEPYEEAVVAPARVPKYKPPPGPDPDLLIIF